MIKSLRFVWICLALACSGLVFGQNAPAQKPEKRDPLVGECGSPADNNGHVAYKSTCARKGEDLWLFYREVKNLKNLNCVVEWKIGKCKGPVPVNDPIYSKAEGYVPQELKGSLHYRTGNPIYSTGDSQAWAPSLGVDKQPIGAKAEKIEAETVLFVEEEGGKLSRVKVISTSVNATTKIQYRVLLATDSKLDPGKWDIQWKSAEFKQSAQVGFRKLRQDPPPNEKGMEFFELNFEQLAPHGVEYRDDSIELKAGAERQTSAGWLPAYAPAKKKVE